MSAAGAAVVAACVVVVAADVVVVAAGVVVVAAGVVVVSVVAVVAEGRILIDFGAQNCPTRCRCWRCCRCR